MKKNVRNCAHWEHQCKNHPIFLSIQYGHEHGHEHELGHGHGHRHSHGRVVHGSDGPAGRVTILPDFGGSGRVST